MSHASTPLSSRISRHSSLYASQSAWVSKGLIGGFFIYFLLFSTSSFSQTTFTEDAASWNLDVGNAKDGGHAWADFDLDGDLDLLVNTTVASSGSRLLRNDGTSFTDVTSTLAPELESFATERERQAAWADLNHDGYPDFVRNDGSAGARKLEIYIQDPNTGVFGNGSGGTLPITVGSTVGDDVTISNGLNCEAIGFMDFDGDGDLDIYFDNHNFGIDILRNNYIDHTTNTIVNPATTVLFSHATPGTGTVLGLPQSATDGDYGACTDMDDNGWVDLVIRKRDGNDFYENLGGIFSTTSDVNLAQANNGNKGAIGTYDLDNDGDFDVVWTDIDGNDVYRNDGVGSFTQLSPFLGVPANGIDGTAGGDIDNDGDIDILLTADNRSYLYINQINSPTLGPNTGTPMTFVLDSETFNSGANGEGATMVDIDDDGDLDIYINISGTNELWLNDLYNGSTPYANKDYVFVDVLEDRTAFGLGADERDAIGATIRLEDCDGNLLSGLREVNGGIGHGTQDPSPVHIGLPLGQSVDYVLVVKYPNYVNGGTTRAEVRKWIRPSDFTGSEPYTIEFRPEENDVLCPYPPTALNDINNTLLETPVSGNVLTNDSDPNGDNLVLNTTPLASPSNGSLTLNANGSYTYTPNAAFTGLDVFVYEVCDDATPSLCDTATVYIHVYENTGVNDPPIANPDAFQTLQDVALTGVSIQANDIDPDGDILTINTTPISSPSNGSVSINSSGIITYTPNASFIGTDEFSYEICDPSGACDTAVVTIDVLPTTGANTTFATDDAASTYEGGTISSSVDGNDFDAEGDAQTVNTTPISGPANGSLTLNANGSYTYTPNAAFSGDDQFVYETCDNGSPSACDTATVYLTVNPCNDAGAITGPSSACEGETQTYSIDPVSGATSYTWTVPAGASITSGQGSTTISVTFGTNSGDICVTANNPNCPNPTTPSCTTISITPSLGPIGDIIRN